MVKPFRPDRRRFLAHAGKASIAAGAGGALLAASGSEAQAYDPGQNERRARYKADAPDVQAFYRTNGYETLKK